MLVADTSSSRQLVRVATAARWLKKDTRTIRWYIETDQLAGVRVGKFWFVDAQAVITFRPRPRIGKAA